MQTAQDEDDDDLPQPPPATLGDVLYAGRQEAFPSEQEWASLVKSVAGGDQLALHALYERTHKLVFTLIVRITADPHSAEELTLDVFHDVWRRASTYDPANGTVLGWIMNQARSRALDRLRYDNRKKRVHAGEPELPMAPAVLDAHAELEFKQQSEAVREALTVLSAEERRAIEAAFFRGLTYAEVALHLAEPLGTIKTRIRSGLHKLRQRLAAGAKP